MIKEIHLKDHTTLCTEDEIDLTKRVMTFKALNHNPLDVEYALEGRLLKPYEIHMTLRPNIRTQQYLEATKEELEEFFSDVSPVSVPSANVSHVETIGSRMTD